MARKRERKGRLVRRWVLDRNGRRQRRWMRERTYRKKYQRFDRRLKAAPPRGPEGEVAVSRALPTPPPLPVPTWWEMEWTGDETRAGGRPVNIEVRAWTFGAEVPKPENHKAWLDDALSAHELSKVRDAFTWHVRKVAKPDGDPADVQIRWKTGKDTRGRRKRERTWSPWKVVE